MLPPLLDWLELPEDTEPVDVVPVELEDVPVELEDVPVEVLVELWVLAVAEWATCCTKTPRLTAQPVATRPTATLTLDINPLLFMAQPSAPGLARPSVLAVGILWMMAS
ncbi:MAG: hypothetical protein ABI140_06945 [Jatrophihabitantaceae bacterium]